MKLYELMEYVDDSQAIKLINSVSRDELGGYDGKNSIDEKYNECEIDKIYAWSDRIVVYVEPVMKEIVVRATVTYSCEFTMEVDGFAEHWDIDSSAEDKLDDILRRAYIEADEGDWELDTYEVDDWSEN